MRQILSRSMLTVAAAGSIMAVTGGYAHADSGASGTAAGSPGVVSGNEIQAPIHIPVNACGDTVNVVGAGNRAFGNSCANESDSSAAAAQAQGTTTDSSGVVAGNSVELPVHVPVNACGDSVDVVGLLNTTSDNTCANGETPAADTPRAVPAKEHAAPAAPHLEPQAESLAETGSGGPLLGAAGATGAALLTGGALLYRRAARSSHAAAGYASAGRSRGAHASV
jgi:hypothetical protein